MLASRPFSLRTLAVGCALFLAAPTAAEAQGRARCDVGFTASVTTVNSGVLIECRRLVTTTVRNYVSYSPCVSPGVYLVSDEISTGSSKGRDRCTAAGVSGPALACAPGLTLEIVEGAKDKCYSTSTKTTSELGEIWCYRPENNQRLACRVF